MTHNLLRTLVGILAVTTVLNAAVHPSCRGAQCATQGSLFIDNDKAATLQGCPLKHTAVKAEISGFLARVTVTQEFENPLSEKIEAVYVFPLPQNSAVDDMTMIVGTRTVKGKIKRREEARAIYEAARAAGHVAGLLDQERPNIFTQSVANIMPGEKVKITISYVETLQYEAGSYEFSFPMVVGPRYVPKSVGDRDRIAPPVTPPGTRAGHDISVEVSLDAGVPIDNLTSMTHDVTIDRTSMRQALVKLRDKATLPNKDFVLKYDVAGRKVEDAVLVHKGAKGGFFSLILQPPEQVRVEDVAPKELVFVIDTSGSMSGFPIEKAKETMRLAIAGLYPRDTFNLITFSGDTHLLFPAPVPATADNLQRAREFLDGRRAGGGTEMMKAVRAALDPSSQKEKVRIVCFMTDGYVGNEFEIIQEVKNHPNARVFSFGIGSSVNRFLLDKMAAEGRGEVEYVSLKDDGSAAARRFHERIRNPLLTDIAIDWAGLPVSDVYPQRIPDLFGAKPVVVHGRYTNAARGVIRLRGKQAGRDFVREIRVDLPASEPRHDVLASLWARTKIDDLMSQDWGGMHRGAQKADVKEAVTALGLEYSLMTQYTSFVAVEEMTVTEGGVPRRIEVPVEMPEGVSYEGIFGEGEAPMAMQAMSTVVRPAPMPARTPGYFGGAVGGVMARREARVDRSVADSATPAKMDPTLRAIAANPAAPSKLVKNGMVEVQVFLTDASEQSIAALKQLGFQVIAQPKTAKIVIGRIAPAKLEALSKLAFVRYVAAR